MGTAVQEKLSKNDRVSQQLNAREGTAETLFYTGEAQHWLRTRTYAEIDAMLEGKRKELFQRMAATVNAIHDLPDEEVLSLINTTGLDPMHRRQLMRSDMDSALKRLFDSRLALDSYSRPDFLWVYLGLLSLRPAGRRCAGFSRPWTEFNDAIFFLGLRLRA